MTTTAHVAELVIGHMAAHCLPEPASLFVMKTLDEHEVRVQVHAVSLTDTAAVLLCWANSLPSVAMRAWRPHEGSVHLDVDTTLTGPDSAAKLTVYGGVPFDPVAFADLEVGQRRPVSLGQLTGWTTSQAGVAA